MHSFSIRNFWNGLNRELCLQAVNGRTKHISKFHHLVPLMAVQDARFHDLQYGVSFTPRITCQESRYVAGWLSSAVIAKREGLVLIRENV